MDKPTEHTVHITEVIDAPIEKIWEIMRDFNGLPSYHPAIQASRIEHGDGESVGSIRHLTLANNGGYVREELLMINDAEHAFDYSIIEGTLPVNDYIASVRLTYDEANQQTICEWWADFKAVNPSEQAQLVDLVGQHVFKVGLQAIAERCAHHCHVCA